MNKKYKSILIILSLLVIILIIILVFGKDDKIKVKINNESHSVTIYSLTNTSVVIKVASTIQTANFSKLKH